MLRKKLTRTDQSTCLQIWMRRSLKIMRQRGEGSPGARRRKFSAWSCCCQGQGCLPGPAAAKAKVVRRLSFSSSRGENDAKKLKISSGSARENKKTTRKPPKSKSKKAGLVFSVSRAHNRLKQG